MGRGRGRGEKKIGGGWYGKRTVCERREGEGGRGREKDSAPYAPYYNCIMSRNV
jgi:hypothetical protein